MQLAAITLTHPRVRLEPFAERCRAGLTAAAADPTIWRHIPFAVVEHGYGAWFNWLMAEQATGHWLPFAVIAFAPPFTGELSSAQRETEGGAASSPHRLATLATSPASGGGKIVGQSCYINPRPKDACVEIGGTWYAPEAQGTAINPAAKLLLLGHAFDSSAERVEFKTDARNARSRAAMEKLGCAFEGVFRRHMRRPDGSWRDTAWYAIIREEWPGVKARLEARLEAFD